MVRNKLCGIITRFRASKKCNCIFGSIAGSEANGIEKGVVVFGAQ